MSMPHPRIGTSSIIWAIAVLGCAAPEREPARAPDAPEAPTAAQAGPATEAVPQAVAAQDARRFHDEVAGFSLSKPEGWHFGTVESEQQNRERVTTGNTQLDELVRTRANASLVTVMKYPEPFEKLNPSIKVILRPLGPLQGKSSSEVASVFVAGLKGAIPGFQVDGEIEEVVISGLPGAQVKAHYSIGVVGQGTKYEVRSRTWVVPRGPYVFMIAMSGPASGEDVSEAEFHQALASVEIRH